MAEVVRTHTRAKSGKELHGKSRAAAPALMLCFIGPLAGAFRAMRWLLIWLPAYFAGEFLYTHGSIVERPA